MTGNVARLHAVLSVPLQTATGTFVTLDFVVDTGFTGFLTLPKAAVDALGLLFLDDIPARLATDDRVMLRLHSAVILWNGVEREVEVLATGKRPLLGTALLENCELVAQFVENGLVTVEAL